MSIKYNKEFIKKDGRRLISRSPRDLQRRQTQAEEATVNLLTLEINELREKLRIVENNNKNLFTAEQVDNDINKIVGKTIEELTTKYEDKLKQQQNNFDGIIDVKNILVSELKDQNKFLTKELCEMKSTDDPEILNKLTALFAEVTEKTSSSKSVRPQMGTVFIDPLEDGAGDGLEAHIDIKDSPVTQKGNVQDKVNKLKNLLGDLKK